MKAIAMIKKNIKIIIVIVLYFFCIGSILSKPDSLKLASEAIIINDTLHIKMRFYNNTNKNIYIPISYWIFATYGDIPKYKSDVLVGVNEIFIYDTNFVMDYYRENSMASFPDKVPYFIKMDSNRTSIVHLRFNLKNSLDLLNPNNMNYSINLNYIVEPGFVEMMKEMSLIRRKVLLNRSSFTFKDLGCTDKSEDCIYEYKTFISTEYTSTGHGNGEYLPYLKKAISTDGRVKYIKK